MRYILILVILLSLQAGASGEKQAKSALTRAVMGIPIMKYTRRDIEYKLQQTDYKFLFYLSPVVTQTLRVRTGNFVYYFDFKSESIFIQYRIDF